MSVNAKNWLKLLNNEHMICVGNSQGNLQNLIDPQYIPVIKSQSHLFNTEMADQLNMLYKAMVTEKYLSEYDF